MSQLFKSLAPEEAALQLEAIIQSATDGIISIDARGRMVLVNQAAAQLFGYSKAEMLGQSINMLMPAHHAQQHDNYIARYMKTGEAQIIGIGREVMAQRKDGSQFPIRLSISEVEMGDRRLFTGIVHDLTQQKTAESALQREKERAQRYLNIANTIIVILDRDGKINLLNDKGRKILEVEPNEAIGKDWVDHFIPDNYRSEVKVVFRALMDGRDIEYYENYIQSASGKQHLVAWHNTLLRDDEGQITGTLSSGIDISAQREAEDRIIRLNQELEKRVAARTEELAEVVNQLLGINKQLKHEIKERETAEAALKTKEKQLTTALEKEKELNELKSRFVSMASHEFRTPLSTILSSADLIEAYQNEEQQKKRLRHTQRIKTSVANLTSILNDFLSLSRLEEGKLSFNPSEFELTAVWKEVEEGVQGMLKKGQQLNIKGLEQIPDLNTDRRILQNIFYNLLSNAIKYSGEGQPIDCKVERKNGDLKIAIQDYGIGIPESEQQHLFTRFFRAHNVENIQGTGLGLNIVKGYVDLLGGHITFESVPEQGSTFRVTIPLEHH
ncbi:PAS domain S-box protein [Phaeodactylibacter sp.]|uniref:PAS domain-containing sensor histidine kinase n=1 Tax=Phaeodactylibacter sp. TaxID=1940289 RepID=UPI0025CBFE6D|nr:PAS domain S-box protein [Phaeodactylibacter sp.]MCI4649981.1 PAS domain S-box protein [Phaeodactylibacter sp.]MCI5093812.1 PAS domain S-box protein [Phaeodactylibacter sp.]